MTPVAADDGGVLLVALAMAFSESTVTTDSPAISPVARWRATMR